MCSGPTSMSSGLKKSIVNAYATMDTMVKMRPNWRSGISLEPTRGSTEQSVVNADAVIEPERARNAARYL